MSAPAPSSFLWHLVLFACADLSLTGQLTTHARSSQSNEEVDRDRRIVGGHPALEGDWPFLVFVGMRKEGVKELSHRCGGSVIDPYYVLTAGHCVFHANGVLAVLAGYTRLPEDGDAGWDDVTEVTSITIHPFYDDMLKQNDVAILKLARPLALNGANISTVSLNSDGSCPAPGQQCSVAGWGMLELASMESVPNTTMEVNVTAVSSEECNDANGNITDDKVCAGELGVGGKDSCMGDSGGPLMCMCDDKWVQVGVVSYGKGCGLPDFPGVYSRVSYNLPWVQSVLAFPHNVFWTPN